MDSLTKQVRERKEAVLRELPPKRRSKVVLRLGPGVLNAVKREVRSAILDLIRRERECELVDKKLVKEVIEIFVEMRGNRNNLEVYVTDFEEMLLSTTADYYGRESAKWVEKDSFPEYMRKAEDRLKQEQERVGHYLHSSTEEKLLKVCDEQLLQMPEQVLLEKDNSGCEVLLRDNKVEDLSRCLLYTSDAADE